MNTEVRIIEHQSTRAPGYKMQDAGYRMQDSRCKMQELGINTDI